LRHAGFLIQDRPLIDIPESINLEMIYINVVSEFFDDQKELNIYFDINHRVQATELLGDSSLIEMESEEVKETIK
jgi:hypothetical protein